MGFDNGIGTLYVNGKPLGKVEEFTFTHEYDFNKVVEVEAINLDAGRKIKGELIV